MRTDWTDRVLDGSHPDRPAAIKREIVDRLTAAGYPATTRIDLDAIAAETLTGPGHTLGVPILDFWDSVRNHMEGPR